MAKKKEQKTYEELLGQLQDTVAELEQGTLPLAELMEKYSEGIKLLSACQELLQQAEQVLGQEKEEGLA